ncbi:hypothetical protein [Commensalibacter oyaizuii]|uniref:Signal transduction histidine kinase dimerisation/phosphoacceptor domain-containing protein n=1 Tax=Commensalibacter oyaizuii TaxID=3043873 RepID=A0ABT6PZ00_9PROT|nr:hypothetical protein [Commensalibacter sp. TBRC 16381]MDI2090080.1 hypothetical protein [Commensalibacter sp. TBRC 16381]
MATPTPSLSPYKSVFIYMISVLSGIIPCIIAFILFKYNVPLWTIFVIIGVYITILMANIFYNFLKQIDAIKNKHEKELSVLRHDVKGLLSPALLMADRILLNKSADEKIQKSAESIAQSIEKVSEYLTASKNKH